MAASQTPQTKAGRAGTPRLEWATKPAAVDRSALPFQCVETINESRATREALRGSLFAAERPAPAATWRNKLIWGDNKLVMTGGTVLLTRGGHTIAGTRLDYDTKAGTAVMSGGSAGVRAHFQSEAK